jgi:LysR family transcriptional regulator, glycine cleavage system transcriptional activator
VQHIPPIQCLLTFEAVARLRSAIKAADELCVTPSAISHRLRQLESQVGFKLFGRADFTLSADGAAYLQNVRVGLGALQQTPARNQAKGRTRLKVAITPTFCRVFVMPRLELFRNAYPDIELILQVSIPLMDVTAEPADLEVRYGRGGYADVEHRLILAEDVTPACSPSLIHEAGPFHGFESADELDRAPLLRSPLEPWTTWFTACGLVRDEPRVGGQFNDMGLAYDAAASGLGIALVRPRLCGPWLHGGRLVRLSQRAVPSPLKHFICWKSGALERWECAAFADWLERTLVPER